MLINSTNTSWRLIIADLCFLHHFISAWTCSYPKIFVAWGQKLHVKHAKHVQQTRETWTISVIGNQLAGDQRFLDAQARRGAENSQDVVGCSQKRQDPQHTKFCGGLERRRNALICHKEHEFEREDIEVNLQGFEACPAKATRSRFEPGQQVSWTCKSCAVAFPLTWSRSLSISSVVLWYTSVTSVPSLILSGFIPFSPTEPLKIPLSHLIVL